MIFINSKMNSKINKTMTVLVLAFIVLFVGFVPSKASAVGEVLVEALPDAKVFNDFVVGPGKIEMELAPGEKGTFDLQISNRLGTVKTFSIGEEDFTGSNNITETVVLLGSDRGPYSLKDYITVSTSTIEIEHGTRVRVPVSVSIPRDAQPGGLYGSVIVGTISKNEVTNSTGGVVSSNPVITRIGTLIFIRVKGDVNESGKLTDFKLAGNKKIIFDSNNIKFNLFYENEGNVHLNPKGTITVKNMLGASVGTITVEPWFAMPKSMRFREVGWNSTFLFGKYTALASVERGYGELSDDASISFWVIPWKIILGIFSAIIIVVAIVKKLFKKKSVIVTILFGIISLTSLQQANAQEVMTSTNYKLESDSINFAGGRSVSGSYIIEDTAGEIATGISSSNNFTMKAGYQQNNVVTISLTPASNVVMSPSIGGLTGGIANGQTSFTVITDSPAGYTATIKAEASPALNTATDSFADYTPVGADPDFTFANASNSSSFAFTPEGADIASRYKNLGASCGVGATDTADACWDGLSAVDKTILNRTSSNQPVGTTSVVKFRAASGSSHVQEDGVYTATTTVTVLSL
jgi:hypothetical protein